MKTKPLFVVTKSFVTLMTVFLLAIFSMHAQCPIVTNSSPPPICDASGYTFADLSSDYATDGGNGIVWYSLASGGVPFNNSQLVRDGLTYYADDNSGSCGVRQSITIDFQVNPSGDNLDKIYCSNENRTIQDYIDEVLLPSFLLGVTSVEIFYDLSLTIQANTTDTLSVGGTNLYIVFIDGSNCRSQIELAQVGVFSSPADPTPVNPQAFCSDTNPTIADLNPGTTATNYSWYNNVDVFGDPIPPVLASTTPLVNGNTYYIQINDVFCTSNAVPVTVEVDDPVNAGTATPAEFCDDSLVANSPFDLFAQLAGEDAGGTWSDDNSTGALSGSDVDLTSLPLGISSFTYTVLSGNACPDATSTVIITIYETLTSGTASPANPATFCESGLQATFDLFTLIENYDTGGQWTQGTLSTDPAVTSPVDLTGFIPGTYNFTYFQNLLPNPCPEESTTVQVIVLADPNAGVAINQVFCENELAANSPFDLFTALDGSQDNNSGIWTDSSNNVISNSLDLTTLTISGSPYTYNYTIDNGICSDTEAITITIEPAPESGIANPPVEFCEGAAPSSFNLFDLLTGEDQNGTWNDDNASGALTGNTVDLSGLAAATYSFTYDVTAIGSCDDVNVTVSIIINPLPNTGTPTNATFCENDLLANSPLDLFGQLSGTVDAGGIWNDDNTSGALSGSNLDLNTLTIGSYNYTYSVTDANGCSNSSTVTVTIEDSPESGTSNSPAEFCLADITTGQTYNLFDLLTGEDQTGIWNDDNASGALVGNTVALDVLNQGTFNFTFDVTAIGSCDDVDMTVSIVINDTPAPTVSSTQEFCDTATVADLVAIGTAIQWYDAATGGATLAGSTALIDGQTYYATQTDATTGCESSVRTPVLATIYISPNAGAQNITPIVACNNDNNIDLFTGLDGTQDAGGIWNNDNAIGSLSGNIFDATGVSAGTYSFTYTVVASAPCLDDSETITITIEEPLSAGTDGAPLDLCSNNGTVDLFTQLGGTPDVGGTWSPALASGTGVFDPLVDADGTYSYTVANACGTNTSNVVVTVTLAPNAGTDNSVALCRIDAPIDLFLSLGAAAQSGGTWSPALASGTGIFDPAIDAPGVYTYTVAAVTPCAPDSTADITVNLDDTPTPTVTNSNPEFCAADVPIVSDLNSLISSTGTINWYQDAALTLPLNGSEALVDGEDYFATQTNSTGCESSSSVQINAIVNDSPTPILLNPAQEYCINDDPTINDLTSNLNYNSAQYNVVWYDSDIGGATVSGSMTLTNTTYYAALIDITTGCESSIRLSVTPNVTACGQLQLPDGFSPNGDGVNDTFDIDNLAIIYPNFEIEIYNRNGNIVYKGNANTPRFDGTSNQSRVVAKGNLPVGVYFYIFRFNDGVNNPEQGRLYLSR